MLLDVSRPPSPASRMPVKAASSNAALGSAYRNPRAPAGWPHLASALLGEGNGEHAEEVAVSGLDVHLGLDQRLPLAHQRAQLVCGEIHALCPHMIFSP